MVAAGMVATAAGRRLSVRRGSRVLRRAEHDARSAAVRLAQRGPAFHGLGSSRRLAGARAVGLGENAAAYGRRSGAIITAPATQAIDTLRPANHRLGARASHRPHRAGATPSRLPVGHGGRCRAAPAVAARLPNRLVRPPNRVGVLPAVSLPPGFEYPNQTAVRI